jgi:hypothetical protein
MPYKLPWFSIKLTTFASWYFLRLTNTMILRLIKIYYFLELKSRMCLARSQTIEQLASARSVDCGPSSVQHLEARQRLRTRRHESWIPTSSTPPPASYTPQLPLLPDAFATADLFNQLPPAATHGNPSSSSTRFLRVARGFPDLRRWIQEVILVSLLLLSYSFFARTLCCIAEKFVKNCDSVLCSLSSKLQFCRNL